MTQVAVTCVVNAKLIHFSQVCQQTKWHLLLEKTPQGQQTRYRLGEVHYHVLGPVHQQNILKEWCLWNRRNKRDTDNGARRRSPRYLLTKGCPKGYTTMQEESRVSDQNCREVQLDSLVYSYRPAMPTETTQG